MLRRACPIALIAAATIGVSATEPNDANRRWWRHLVALSGDDQGHDTGNAGRRRAVQYVVQQLERHGVIAAGENGFFQRVLICTLGLARGRSRAPIIRGRRNQAPAWKPGSPLAPGAN